MIFDQDAIKFRKKGSAIKAAVRSRCAALRARLDHRNEALDALMGDRNMPTAPNSVIAPQFHVGHTGRRVGESGC